MEQSTQFDAVSKRRIRAECRKTLKKWEELGVVGASEAITITKQLSDKAWAEFLEKEGALAGKANHVSVGLTQCLARLGAIASQDVPDKAQKSSHYQLVLERARKQLEGLTSSLHEVGAFDTCNAAITADKSKLIDCLTPEDPYYVPLRGILRALELDLEKAQELPDFRKSDFNRAVKDLEKLRYKLTSLGFLDVRISVNGRHPFECLASALEVLATFITNEIYSSLVDDSHLSRQSAKKNAYRNCMVRKVAKQLFGRYGEFSNASIADVASQLQSQPVDGRQVKDLLISKKVPVSSPNPPSPS